MSMQGRSSSRQECALLAIAYGSASLCDAEASTGYRPFASDLDSAYERAARTARTWALMTLAIGVLLTGVLLWAAWRIAFELGLQPRGPAISQQGSPPISEQAVPGEQAAWLIRRFISQVRSVPSDATVLSRDFLDAYHYVDAGSAATLNEYARDADPYSILLDDARVVVDVAEVSRTSMDMFRVDWVERRYSDGQFVAQEFWQASLATLVGTPTDANPLGIYFHIIDWSAGYE
jgi:type IV secretion system protein TrbF